MEGHAGDGLEQLGKEVMGGTPGETLQFSAREVFLLPSLPTLPIAAPRAGRPDSQFGFGVLTQ